jgi:aldehyde:ferredoxin oxidoreductase
LCGLSPTQGYSSERYESVRVDRSEEGFSILYHWRSKLKKYSKVMAWDEDTGIPHEKNMKELELEKASKMHKKERGPHQQFFDMIVTFRILSM